MAENRWNQMKEIVQNIDLNRIDANAKIILFGAGMNGSFAYSKLKDKFNIVAFSDNNTSLWGKEHEGIPVIEPGKISEIENVFVFVTVTGQHYVSIKKQLEELELPFMIYMEYVLAQHFKDFEHVYLSLLEDEESKIVYSNILISHLLCTEKYLKEIFVRNQYFEIPEFNIPSTKEVFVDCGAFTGDTMESYVLNRAGMFKKIYSFEPTQKTYNALCYRRERLLREWALEEDQILPQKYAVSDEDKEVYFGSEINGEKSNRIFEKEESAVEKMECVALDSFFSDKKEMPTFIKADIEGAETDLILGARKIIMENRPLLAICVYHKVEDLYEIPMMLKKLNPDYKMSLRHHMPNYYETVLYCYE